MEEPIRDQLNRFYRPIDLKAKEFTAKLVRPHSGFCAAAGFFNGHYHKNEAGKYREDAYPIPVIDVKGLCDIEIDFDSIRITTKLKKEQLLALDWSKLGGTQFEVYGVEDYLCDYGNNQELLQMNLRIVSSRETEFFVSFLLPPDYSADEAIVFLKQLHNMGFYY